MQGLGTLDRTGVVHRPATPIIGDGGDVNNVFERAGTVRLRRETPSSRTIIAGARDADAIEDIFVMRWVDGFGPGWQVTIEGRAYRVLRADEIGRRRGWRVYGRIVV